MASGNLWQLFKGVTEQGAKQLATVIDRQGSNYTVTMQGGGNTIVQSSAAYELQSKGLIPILRSSALKLKTSMK